MSRRRARRDRDYHQAQRAQRHARNTQRVTRTQSEPSAHTTVRKPSRMGHRQAPRTPNDLFNQLLAEQAPIAEIIAAALKGTRGPRRNLTVISVLVAMAANTEIGGDADRPAYIAGIARTIDSWTDNQLLRVGVTHYNRDHLYANVWHLYNDICTALDNGIPDPLTGELRDWRWFTLATAGATINPTLITTRSRAVDGSMLATFAVPKRCTVEITYDGDPHSLPDKPATRPSYQVLGTGPDGRKIYTADRDARMGHGTATNSRTAGYVVGYELHAITQVPDLRWTNGTDKASLGPRAAPYIVDFAVVPAGSHRAKAIVDQVIADLAPFAAAKDHPNPTVLWDPGMSLLKAGDTHLALRAAGIDEIYDIASHQRGTGAPLGDAIVIDQHVYHPSLPEELKGIKKTDRHGHTTYEPFPKPPIGADPETRRQYQEPYNRRAVYAYRRNSRDPLQLICPVCAGIIKIPGVQRRSRTRPGRVRPVTVAPPATPLKTCCEGIITDPNIRFQPIPPGTTAHAIRYSSRTIIEGRFGDLKANSAHLGNKDYIRVLALKRRIPLVAAVIARYNRHVTAAWTPIAQPDGAAQPSNPPTPSAPPTSRQTVDGSGPADTS